jgi:hypothetical protein
MNIVESSRIMSGIWPDKSLPENLKFLDYE